jgi:hypothetical protein
MVIAFAVLPIRGLVAAYLIKSWGVFRVQILDGIGAGLQSVAVPALVRAAIITGACGGRSDGDPSALAPG